MDASGTTWKRRLADSMNLFLTRAGMRLVRASSSDRYVLQGYTEEVCDGTTMRFDPQHASFWAAFRDRRWEPQTLEILARHLNATSVYYDIGAWIGPTVVFAAQRSKTVFAFEPDPVAYRYLLENITNNSLTNVRAFNLAVAATAGVSEIHSFGSKLGDSMSSLLPHAEGSSGWPVTRVTIDTVVSELGCAPPDFMKIDIEGGEFELLPALRSHLERWKPIVYLSLHAPVLPAEEREERLGRLARALDFYPTVIDYYDQSDRGSSPGFKLSTLPTSPYRDEFGSLLLLPSPSA
jgi:FkbM family methyltransferase